MWILMFIRILLVTIFPMKVNGTAANAVTSPCTSKLCGTSAVVNCEIDEEVHILAAVTYLSRMKTVIETLNLNGTEINSFIHLAPYHKFGNASIRALNILAKVTMSKINRMNQTFLAQRKLLVALKIGGNSWRLQGTLRRIPSRAISVLSTLETADFSRNEITAVDKSDLAGLESLKTLDLSNNFLQNVDTDTFQPVKQTLVRLLLSSNRLVTMPKPDYEMTNVEEIRICNNRLKAVSLNLARIFPNLTQLALSDNSISIFLNQSLGKLTKLENIDLGDNHLKIIERNTFHSGITSLSVVSLDGNRISTLEQFAFNQLPSLRSVYLGNNVIAALQDHTFFKLPNLEELYLGTNMISNIGRHAFSSLPKLKKLELWDNHLSVLSEPTFSPIWTDLFVLDAGSNYFKCDCSVLWIYQSIHGEGMKPPEELLMYCTNDKQRKAYDMDTIDIKDIDCPQKSSHQMSPSFQMMILLYASDLNQSNNPLLWHRG